jgi:hypothetical protein
MAAFKGGQNTEHNSRPNTALYTIILIRLIPISFWANNSNFLSSYNIDTAIKLALKVMVF